MVTLFAARLGRNKSRSTSEYSEKNLLNVHFPWERARATRWKAFDLGLLKWAVTGLFYALTSTKMFFLNIAVDWTRTTDLWWQKRPLWQAQRDIFNLSSPSQSDFSLPRLRDELLRGRYKSSNTNVAESYDTHLREEVSLTAGMADLNSTKQEKTVFFECGKAA